MPGTRKLGKPTDQRKAMLRGMVTLLRENGQVVTTVTRAKELRSIADKMITLGKKSLEEVIQKLHSLGLDLKKEEE